MTNAWAPRPPIYEGSPRHRADVLLDQVAEISLGARRAGRDLLASEQREVLRLAQEAIKLRRADAREYGGYPPTVDDLAAEIRQRLDAAEEGTETMPSHSELAAQLSAAGVSAENVRATADAMQPPGEPGRKLQFGTETKPRDAAAGPVFTLGDGRQVRGALPADRFADLTPGGPPEVDYSVGEAVLDMLTGARNPQAAQQVQVGPDGGFWTAPQISDLFIDQARSMSVLIRAGAITLPLLGAETRVVKVDTDPTAAWKDELAALTNTTVKLGAVQLVPKTLGAVVDLSQELIDDAANSAPTVQRVLAEAVAVQLDRSLFRGVEAGRPFTGVLDDPDVSVTDVGTNGVAPTAATGWNWWADAIEDVRTNNGEPDVYIEHPRTSAQFTKLKDANNQPLQAPAEVAALRRLISTQVPIDQDHGTATNATSVVVGNFSTAFVLLGIRSNFRVETSREAGNAFENLGVKVRIWGRFDLAIGRPKHLARIEGIIP